MARPTRSEPNAVWLGDSTTDENGGWLPIEGDPQLAQLAVFPPKVTIGPTSRDSEQFVHTWVMGNWAAGVGVENMDEGADADRTFFSVADTRGPFRTSLPPRVVLLTSPAAGAAYPLGDVHDTTSGLVTRHAVAFGSAVYTTANGGASWTSVGSLPGAPVGKGVAFAGTDATALLYVPCGAAGFATVTPAGLTAHAADATHPAAVTFCVDNTSLFAVDTAGVFWQTVGGDVWEEYADHDQDGFMALDRSELPRRLVQYMNRAGTPTPILVTNRALWEVDLVNHRLGKLHFTYPPHPEFGKAVEVFRPGEDLLIGAGLDLIAYGSNGVIDPDKSPTRDDGLPEQYLGRIADLQAEMSSLYAWVEGGVVADNVVQATAGSGFLDADVYVPSAGGSSNTLLAYNSLGWHGMFADAAVEGSPTWATVSAVEDQYKLWFGDTAGKIRTLKLNLNFQNPKRGLILGSDEFAAAGFVETPRFDGNMESFTKVAIGVDVKCDWATATETVTVSYRTDADVVDGLNASVWHVLGTVSSPELTHFNFDLNEDGVNEGQAFEWIQLRYDLARGADVTQSPLLDSAVLRYTVVPQNVASYAFRVKLPQDRYKGRKAGEIVQHLNDMLVSRELPAFVHHNKTYAVRVSGVSGSDRTGEDRSGTREVTLIVIRDPGSAQEDESE